MDNQNDTSARSRSLRNAPNRASAASSDIARHAGRGAFCRYVARWCTTKSSIGVWWALKRPADRLRCAGTGYWPEWEEVKLGYVHSHAAQGQGLGQEDARAWIDWAIANLSEDHLIAVIHPDNAPSARLAQRLGFAVDRREVTQR